MCNDEFHAFTSLLPNSRHRRRFLPFACRCQWRTMHRVCMGAMSSVIYMTLPQQRHTLGAGILTSLFLGVSIGIFDRFAPAVTMLTVEEFRRPEYRSIIDGNAATDFAQLG